MKTGVIVSVKRFHIGWGFEIDCNDRDKGLLGQHVSIEETPNALIIYGIKGELIKEELSEIAIKRDMGAIILEYNVDVGYSYHRRVVVIKSCASVFKK